jgi:hypothetical protein
MRPDYRVLHRGVKCSKNGQVNKPKGLSCHCPWVPAGGR